VIAVSDARRHHAELPIRRWLAPPLTAFIFLVHPIVTLLWPARQLQDPGTGWHLATGRWILATHTLPHHDVFSFTAAGQPWVTYYWLFEAIGAVIERIGGLPLYGTVCMLIYACIPVLLYRRMIRMGATVLAALLATFLAYFVLASHGLARPHVVTYLLFAFFLERMDDVHSGRRPASAVWVLPPLAALWCNMHGGFLAGLALGGILAGMSAASALVTGTARDRGNAVTFMLLFLALGLATLLNPNGIGLHIDTVHHLAMRTTGLFAEFRSPDFGAGGPPIIAFEILVLATVVIAARSRERLSWLERALLVFFLHQALHSVRHVNLFAIVAAPILARELSDPIARRWPGFAARWREIAAEQAALRSPVLYLPALAALFVVLALTGRTDFPRDLDGLQLSRGATAFIAAHKDRFARPFNTDNLGGSLIYALWPDVRVFVDDRIYVYGDDFIADVYMPILTGQPGWQERLDRYDVDSAIVAATAPCATLLRAEPGWQVAYEDEQNVLFFRSSPPTVATPSS
jgi:hypothetical protein